jgi:hypothetical protein
MFYFDSDVFHPKSCLAVGGRGNRKRGVGRGGRVWKEKQLELISWVQAKKEAQALGNLLASCDTAPLPAQLASQPVPLGT